MRKESTKRQALSAKRPILVSGIQPTGRLHVGNYLGALKNFVDLQNSGIYQCRYFIADLHSLTEDYDPTKKRAQILELAADMLAAGLDAKKSLIYLQSQIPAHSELCWILNTITPMGELSRMTQFKDKSRTDIDKKIFEKVVGKIPHKEFERITRKKDTNNDLDQFIREFSTNVGLFDYPVLMAADIILYDAAFVPVGDDQDQHLELTRTLARKFNNRFGETFIEPKALHTPTPRVMSLTNPEKKMSKSEPTGCLFMDDAPDEIEKKLKRAVTDSGSEVKYEGKKKPAISNLLEMYAGVSGETIPQLEKKFRGKGYGDFKMALARKIADHFASFRERKKKLLAKPAVLVTTLKSGSAEAAKIANAKMAEVKQKIGLAL